jgi:hypothetical protein
VLGRLGSALEVGVLRALGLRPAAGAVRAPLGLAAAPRSAPPNRSDGRAAGRELGDAPRVAEGLADGVEVARSDGRAEGEAVLEVPAARVEGVAVGRVEGAAFAVLADGGVRAMAGLEVGCAAPRSAPATRAGVAVGVPDRRVAVLTPALAGFSLYVGPYRDSGEGL